MNGYKISFIVLFTILSLVNGRRVQNPCEDDYKIPCDNGQCITSGYWCDGEVDCSDGSDEAFCQKGRPSNCTNKHFDCGDGKCIPISLRCNVWSDCDDNSDEKNCGPDDWNRRTSTSTRNYNIFPHTTASTSTTETYTASSTNYYQSRRGKESDIRSITGLISTERNLTRHFLKIRCEETHSINKWGKHAPRIAVGLFLNDQRFFALGNRTGEEIAYELSLQLSSKLALKEKIPTKDLALYINALTVACVDPKDFFGVNLVNELRKRVNSSNYTNPFSVLTLCNANDTMTMDDVNKLQQQYDAHFRPMWTDTQAMVVMALSCVHSRTDLNFDGKILDEMVSELKRRQHKNGTIDNLKSTALVVQALLAAGKHRKDFDLNAAIKFLLQEVRQHHPSPHDIYYILPILNSMTLANITSDHCVTSAKQDIEVINNLRGHPDERIQIHFSVIVGDNADFSRTWKVKVPSNYTFYQVLEKIGTLEPAYRVQYGVSKGKPYVVGLDKFQDDTGDGLFWFIYTKPLSSTGSPKLIEQSPVDIQVKESEELILWYRSGFWANTQESPSR